MYNCTLLWITKGRKKVKLFCNCFFVWDIWKVAKHCNLQLSFFNPTFSARKSNSIQSKQCIPSAFLHILKTNLHIICFQQNEKNIPSIKVHSYFWCDHTNLLYVRPSHFFHVHYRYTCFDALHVYKSFTPLESNIKGHPDEGKQGLSMFRYFGCTGEGNCGPNYCCCKW